MVTCKAGQRIGVVDVSQRSLRIITRIAKASSNKIVIRFNAVKTRNSVESIQTRHDFFPAGGETPVCHWFYAQNRLLFTVYDSGRREPFVQNQQWKPELIRPPNNFGFG